MLRLHLSFRISLFSRWLTRLLFPFFLPLLPLDSSSFLSPSFSFLFFLPASSVACLSAFLSSVCPIWTVTCLIFSRPSSLLCRALLPSPTPIVPGEVRYLHTYTFSFIFIYIYIYKNKCTSRDADMRIIRLTQVNLFPSGCHSSTCVHPSIWPFVMETIHPPPSSSPPSSCFLQGLM